MPWNYLLMREPPCSCEHSNLTSVQDVHEMVSSHVRTEPQGVISLWDSLECVELGDLLDGVKSFSGMAQLDLTLKIQEATSWNVVCSICAL